MTKRQAIDSLRNKLRERNADSNYSNQFLYRVLLEHAKWLIKREIDKGRIYGNTSFFQILKCQDIIETSIIDPCCPIKTNCKIYRTKNKLPDLWNDTSGPIIKAVTSVDFSTYFFLTTITDIQNKKDDPYQKKCKTGFIYAFYSEGYIWFLDDNPHKINIDAFWMDDISGITDMCDEDCKDKECVRYLDTRFFIPDWIEAEMMGKALEQLSGISKRLPEDNQIDKNPTRKD